MDLQGQRDQREIETTRGERDQLRIRAEAAEARVAEATKELAALRVQRSPGDQEEVTRLCAELLAQQAVARSLQEIVTADRPNGASASRATGASVGQYLAGSSSHRRNEEEERRRRGEGSAQSGRGGGEMPPPPDRQEGSGESGGEPRPLGRTLRQQEERHTFGPSLTDIYGTLEECPELYWNGQKKVRQGREGPPMGLEEEAGHPSSGCRQQSWGVGGQKAPHPDFPKRPCWSAGEKCSFKKKERKGWGSPPRRKQNDGDRRQKKRGGDGDHRREGERERDNKSQTAEKRCQGRGGERGLPSEGEERERRGSPSEEGGRIKTGITVRGGRKEKDGDRHPRKENGGKELHYIGRLRYKDRTEPLRKMVKRGEGETNASIASGETWRMKGGDKGMK
ncbi:hypothetical protein Taro_005814 [Colocasia esculenta]|uniref:Uncharacterized protein n=1 Tax=Colocasia esculenta TaxID=4460 RepID=A0A843TVK4_COLES|nr:hypothetical protein [Colocasia esculenta]